MILLDVVMEREDSGLTLVRHIREVLQLSEVRIILRTGQPGYAPEIEAIRDYDINDYKTKSELTRAKLYTTLTASLRSYDQIRAINAGRPRLDRIVDADAEDTVGEGVVEHGRACARHRVVPDEQRRVTGRSRQRARPPAPCPCHGIA